MIWLLDLDNTLVGRAEAFASWATGAVDVAGGSAADLAAILTADEGGHGSKAALARVLIDRLGWDDDVPAAIERFRAGILEGVRPYDGVVAALDALREAGHPVAIVTNGASAQQRGKIARCGLGDHVDAVVVSEEEGVAKPDPRLLEVALERLGAADADRRQVWMVGDAGHADVAAGRGGHAHRVGLARPGVGRPGPARRRRADDARGDRACGVVARRRLKPSSMGSVPPYPRLAVRIPCSKVSATSQPSDLPCEGFHE